MKFLKRYEVKTALASIFTGLVGLALISYLFVNVSFADGFKVEFGTIFFISFSIGIAMTVIWYPIAKQKEEARNTYYQKQRTKYSMNIDRIIQTNNFDGLKEFCKHATEFNRTEAIKHKLAKINIDYEVYLKCSKDIGLVDKQKNLDEKQKKALIKIITKGLTYSFLGIKFKGYETVNHTAVTTGVDNAKSYSVRNDEKSFDKRIFTAKVITSIMLSMGFCMIIFTGKGFDLGKLAQIVTWAIMIAYNIISAIINGTKAISIHKTNYYKKLVTFTEEFFSSKYYNNSIVWTPPKIKDDEEENKERKIKKLDVKNE